MPHHVGLRMTVQKQHRRAAPTVPDSQFRLARVDVLEHKAVEHVAPLVLSFLLEAASATIESVARLEVSGRALHLQFC